MNSTTTTKKPTYPGFGIDFITQEFSEDGQHYIKSTNFDCYRETYENGIFSGTRMVYQIMAALEKMPDDGTPDGLVRSVVEEAANLSKTEDSTKDYSFRGIANGVLIGFDELIVDIARSGQWRASMVKSLTSELDYLKSEHDQHVEATTAFMLNLGAVPATSIGASEEKTVNGAQADNTPTRITASAIAALEGMASHAASLADLCNGDGMVVDVLDHAGSLYREAIEASDGDVLLSILCSAESFAASAWAIARCQAIDDGDDHAPHVALLKTFKDLADEIANQFDQGGIHHFDTPVQVIEPKTKKAKARKAVTA
jgi:hypothetical protein